MEDKMKTMHENNLVLFWIVTILVIIGNFIPAFVNYICSLYSHNNKKEIDSREQLNLLKTKLKEINMMDQFAKYAKIQRKINKIQDELVNDSMSKNFSVIKLRLFAYIILYAVTGLTMMYISWMYKYIPLLVMESNLFYPFGLLLSFPTGIKGAIGIIPWICISTTISKSLIEFYTYNLKILNTISD